ncbi:hypothetical protein V7S43_014588 [Phytophthora oleae]|uniref:GOST seven transmembrane domain-containing protein n=1 Tax=Phytophthora oleae TaxID=2107226 RepID=A0ABD3F0V8_9STRA
MKLQLLAWFVAVCGVQAVKRDFGLQFVYEDTEDLLVPPVGPRVCWNSQSVISGFGMEQGARLQLELTGLEVIPADDAIAASAVPVAFTLYDNDQWRGYAVIKLREVHIRSDFVLCHYPAAMRFVVPPPDQKAKLPWKVTFVIKKSSQYTLQAQVCVEASVNVTGHVSMVNLGYDGDLSEHLGVQELGLRPLYKVLFSAYLATMILWMLECYFWRRNVSKICYLFQACLQAKTLSIALKIAYYRERSIYGEVYTFLDFAQDLGESITSAVLQGVSVLGALGWSVTRAYLSRKETFSLLFVAAVYLVVTVNKALCRPTDTQHCRGFLLSEYALQSMMMLGVIIALNFTIAQLKHTINYERWNCFVTPLRHMKLEQFQRFRLVYLVYLLMPTVLLLLTLVVVTPPGYWRYAWVNTFLTEVTALVVVINIGLFVRPVDPYIYSRIARNTSSDADTRGSTDLIEPPPLGGPQPNPAPTNPANTDRS